MKILSITAQKPHSTGSGTYMTELVRSFDRMGHEQAIVCGIYPDDEVHLPDGAGCFPVYFTKKSSGEEPDCHPCAPELYQAASRFVPRVSFPIAGMSDVMPYESTRYRDMTPAMTEEFENAFMDAVNRAVEGLSPDLIICHHLFLLTSLVRKHFPDRKVIGICHGSDLRQMVNCDNLRESVRPLISELDMAFALHSEQAARIRDIYGMDEEHVRVIGSGYDHSRFSTCGRPGRLPESPVRLCYAGKISRAKGVPELIAAAELLAADETVPEFTLEMAGGCSGEELRDQMEHLPLYAKWLGFVAPEELEDMYQRSDIFVLPSYYEGLPLVLIESMASGCVPVCTDLPGVRDWIDAHVGGSNVRYVQMPPLKSADEPTDEGRIRFTEDLARTLKDTIDGIKNGRASALPDTSLVTWDGVAGRLLRFCS